MRLYLKNDAYKEGEFELSSGKKSNFYFEIGNVINNNLCLPRLIELLHYDIIEIMRSEHRNGFVGVAGIALGGAQIVSAYTARHSYFPSLTVRIHKPDWDDENNRWWGEVETTPHIKPGKVVLVDDVLTTGNSLLFAKDILKNEGFEVIKAFVIVDRQENGLEFCKTKGLEVKSLFTKNDISEGS